MFVINEVENRCSISGDNIINILSKELFIISQKLCALLALLRDLAGYEMKMNGSLNRVHSSSQDFISKIGIQSISLQD